MKRFYSLHVLGFLIFILVWSCTKNYSPLILEVDQLWKEDPTNPVLILSVQAEDPDGDSLSFVWASDFGFWDSDSCQQEVRWLPPFELESKIYTINLWVSDGLQRSFYPVYVHAPPYQGILDPRDDRYYPVVKIDRQYWIASNMQYDPGSGTFCYDGHEANCEEYGRLYTWDKARAACPPGWHLPTRNEWVTMVNSIGDKPGYQLKSTKGWTNGGNGADLYGLNIIPAGQTYIDMSFGHLKRHANFWTSTEDDYFSAWSWRLDYYGDGVYPYSKSKELGLSVRCVK